MTTIGAQLTTFLASHVEWIYGAVSGVIAWFVINMAARPVLEIRDKRLEALAAAARYGFVGYSASEDLKQRAISSLVDIVSSLQARMRGQPWPARVYCRLLRYNLEEAVLALNGLAHMVGDPRYDDSTRQNNLNLFYLSFRAHRHLSPEAVRAVKKALKEERARHAQT